MKELLYVFARRLKGVHDYIVLFSSGHFNDKQLHFIVLGLTGMIIFAVTFPIFSLFDRWDNSFAMASLYTVVITIILTVSMTLTVAVTPTFIIIPLIMGVCIFIVSYRVFKYWDNRDEPIPITNFFAITMTIVFAFAIELFQKFTNTGSPEIEDALAGILGYIIMYIAFRIILSLVRHIRRMFSHRKDH